MSDFNLISSKDHCKKFAHFSALVSIAVVDGKIDENEMCLLRGFATKLGIDDNEFNMIIENPTKYPVEKTTIVQKRLRRLFEMFQIIFSNHDIDESEKEMVMAYAEELGFPSNYSKELVELCIKMYRGEFTFSDYTTFVERKY